MPTTAQLEVLDKLGVPRPPTPPVDSDALEPNTVYLVRELRAIDIAADELASANAALAEVEAAIDRASHDAFFSPPEPGPDVTRDAALKYIERKPLPDLPPISAVDVQQASDGRRVLAELRKLRGEREEVRAKANGALRLAIIAAEDGHQRRDIAAKCAGAARLMEVDASIAAAEQHLCTWGGGKLRTDPNGWAHNVDMILAPPPELRPKSAQVEELSFRDVIYAPTMSVHATIKARVLAATEHQLRKRLGDRVPWPFPF